MWRCRLAFVPMLHGLSLLGGMFPMFEFALLLLIGSLLLVVVADCGLFFWFIFQLAKAGSTRKCDGLTLLLLIGFLSPITAIWWFADVPLDLVAPLCCLTPLVSFGCLMALLARAMRI